MNRKLATAITAGIALLALVLLVVACRDKPFSVESIQGYDVSNVKGALEVTQPTSVPTTQPGLQVDSEGAVGNVFELRASTTPVVAVDSSGNIDSEGSADFATLFYPGFADLTVTDGTTPTLTTMVTALDAAAEVTITLAACTTEGEIRILIADDTGPVNVNDTNIRTHDGAALALGANDAAIMVCQDAEWVVLLEAALQ